MTRAGILLLLSLCASCCVPFQMSDPNGQFNVTVKNSTKSAIDPEIVRSSQALHSYLMGQLSYGREDFTAALKSFSKTSELLEEPAPIVHSKLAELYLRGGDLEKALTESKKALDNDPDNIQLKLLYAGILDSLGRDSEVEPVYLEIISKHPATVEPYIFLSSVYIKQKKSEKSIEILRRLEKQSPKDSLAWYYLGRAFEERGELSEAERYLRKAHEADSDRINYTVDLVRVLLKSKKAAKAKEVCNELLKKDPENIVARKILGQLLLGESNYDEALKHLQVLESVEKDSTDTRFKIALIQIEKQNLTEAVRELNLVLAENPGHAEARYYLGSVYAGSGQKKEAVIELLKIGAEQKMFVKARTLAAFILRQDGDLEGAEDAINEARKQSPTDRQLLDYLVLILRDEKKYSDAEKLLKEFVEASPQDEKLLFSYSLVLNDLARIDDSIETMEKILVVNPKNAEALNFVAYSLSERNRDLPRALEYVNRALVLDPDNGYYLDTLGWIYYQNGKFKESADTLSRAVAVVTDDIILLEHYGDALAKSGDLKNSLSTYEKALEREIEKKEIEQIESRKRIQEKVSALRTEHPDLATQDQPKSK